MAHYTTVIEEKILTEAMNHSQRRIEFEYNRFGLSRSHRINMILIGTIGQLIFKKFLDKENIDHKFEYQAGQYDNFDFTINNKIFEIKTSGYNVNYKRLNLLYTKDQFESGLKKNFHCCILVLINGYDRQEKRIKLKNCNKAIIIGGIKYRNISFYKNAKKFFGDDFKVPLKKLEDIYRLID